MEDSAATAALVGVVMALIELVKKLTSRSNGGQNGKQNNRHVDYRLETMGNQIDELKEAVIELKTSFYEFREEVRIRLVRLGDDK